MFRGMSLVFFMFKRPTVIFLNEGKPQARISSPTGAYS